MPLVLAYKLLGRAAAAVVRDQQGAGPAAVRAQTCEEHAAGAGVRAGNRSRLPRSSPEPADRRGVATRPGLAFR